MIKNFLAILVLIAILTSGCAQQTQKSESAAVEGDTIIINNFAFEPSELSVSSGTTVIWKQNDNVVHTIVSQGLFESKVLNKGDEFNFTFTKTGEYSYFCSIHPSMKGKVIVK